MATGTDPLRTTASANPASGAWLRVREWLARADTDQMPRRVARQLDEQRRRNEILAGWMQAALVATFALLYAFSRKTAPLEASFHPVPWALAIYACFTSWRLHLAYRNRLSHAVLMVSVVADMALLMLTIWTFHIEYGQPAAFYLKAPTLLYVFIFIALRVLSVAPGYVLFAGLCAAAGWSLMLGYALMEPGGRDLITRDYVDYMTSARILLGGEIDKIVSILLVAFVLTVAAARGRALLFRAVAEGAAAAQLSRFFAPEAAAAIMGADEALKPGQGRQVEAAAMFIDMRGFTRLAAQLPPCDLLALLGQYQRAVVPVIQRNGGSVDGFLGDGVMATFGAARRSSTYAADAFRAAEQLLDALDAWAGTQARAGRPAPGIGIGVDVGTVTYGVIGDESRIEYTVIGDPVNRAAKLQNHTKAEGVRALATVSALERAVRQGYDRARALKVLTVREVAGIGETLDLVAIR
ncbi:MAG: adenylate/guanylate cyclase domain-containing protein [Betaproteobacteria bacterium]|nr:adenylate/guanylate cyclase domain-containing protein [Betaproteobacteria bacterium]